MRVVAIAPNVIDWPLISVRPISRLHPPEPVTSNNNPTFVGTPSIHGGIPYEIGQHWFVGQDMSNKIWFGSSENDSALIE